MSFNKVKRWLRKGVKTIRTKELNSIQYATTDDYEDIGASINAALERAGENGSVMIEPGQYTKATGEPLLNHIETQYADQTIFGWGADIELADGVNEEPFHIHHDGITVENLDIIGNRDNNNFTACLLADGGFSDILLRDIDVTDADVGIQLEDTQDTLLIGSQVSEGAGSVGTGIKLANTDATTISSSTVRRFNEYGVVFENCENISTSSFNVSPLDGASATAGVYLHGTKDSNVNVIVDADDNMSYGIQSEVFDPGGANESIPTGNVIRGSVLGVSDTGVYLSDSDTDRIEITVNGAHSNGRTTEAFDIDAPNGSTNPSHYLDITGTILSRITNTQISGTNIGVRASGHFTKIQNTGTYQLGGESSTNFTFGEATVNPALDVLTGTEITFRQVTKKSKTDNNGQVNIDWSDKYALEDKPVLAVSFEQAGQWHVASWNTDGNGRYTDADIQITDSGGTAVGNNVEVQARVTGV